MLILVTILFANTQVVIRFFLKVLIDYWFQNIETFSLLSLNILMLNKIYSYFGLDPITGNNIQTYLSRLSLIYIVLHFLR